MRARSPHFRESAPFAGLPKLRRVTTTSAGRRRRRRAWAYRTLDADGDARQRRHRAGHSRPDRSRITGIYASFAAAFARRAGAYIASSPLRRAAIFQIFWAHMPFIDR